MNMSRLPAIVIASALATAAMAQTSGGKPLNLKLPPNALPATSASSTAPATSSSAASRAPGVYYGDTSGSMGATEDTTRAQACDDSTYNQPQVHGSVGMGVMGGSHVSGNYQGGTVSLSRAFGSCDDPHGGVSISIGGTTGHFHGHP